MPLPQLITLNPVVRLPAEGSHRQTGRSAGFPAAAGDAHLSALIQEGGVVSNGEVPAAASPLRRVKELLPPSLKGLFAAWLSCQACAAGGTANDPVLLQVPGRSLLQHLYLTS